MTTEYSDGDYLYGADLDNLVENSARNGVLTGLGVTENTPTPDMNVIVAAGNGFAGETYVNKASSTVVPITAAHATLDRLDIIVINSSGTISAVAGTPATPPNPPDLPDDSILLAIVEVDHAVTQILNANIIDRRLLLGSIQEEMIGDGEITYSKLTLTSSIKDADIDTGNWSYAKKTAAETISGLWEITNTFRIKNANNIEFRDGSDVVKGSIRGTVSGNLVIEAANTNILFKENTLSYVILEVDTNSTTLGGIDPTNGAKGILGDVNAWWQVRACNLNDVCSEIPIPKDALTTLESIMLEDIGAKIREDPTAYILKSEKLPQFLREEDKPPIPARAAIPPQIVDGKVIEGKPAFPGRPARPGHMRNLSATVSFLQGCIYELLTQIKQLEARMETGGL